MEWIKLDTGLFGDEKIRLLTGERNGDELICIWVRLLCLAGKLETDGVLMLTEDTPYTVAQLARLFEKTPAKMRDALNRFESLGMTRTVNGAITIPNWCKHQGTSYTREQYKRLNRERQKRYAERQKRVSNGVSDCVSNDMRDSVSNGKMTETDKDLDLDKDLEKRKDKKKSVSKRNDALNYQQHHYTEDECAGIYLDLQAAAENLTERTNNDGSGQ